MDETSMDEFFDAMEDDYQSDSGEEMSESDVESVEESTDSAQDGEEAPEKEEISEGADEPSEEEKPTETEPESQTYVLRVNHEDKPVTLEELKNYAQMGVDYNRVKTQLEQAKTDNSGLNAKVAEMQGVFDTISELAQASNMSVADMIRQFEETRYTSLGYTQEAAKLAVDRDHLKKEVGSLQSKKPATEADAQKERADREVAEFAEQFPDVELNDELVSKLMKDVQSGMTLSNAYQKMLRAEQAQQIEELKKQLEAEKQNAANRTSSPGSVQDSGVRHKRDKFDDFFDNF